MTAMEISLGRIRIGERTRKDLGDLTGLAESMAAIGLLHPVLVDSGYALIAGQRRLEAARRLGWTKIAIRVIDLADPLRAERDENTERKPFAPSELVAIGRRIEEVERDRAKQRQQRTQVNGKLPGGKPAIGPGKFPEPMKPVENGRAREHVAAAIGISDRTYEKARAVVEAAERQPMLKPLVEAMDETGNVNGTFKKLQEFQAKYEPKERGASAKPPAAGRSRQEVLAAVEKAVDNDAGVRWCQSLSDVQMLISSIDKIGGMKAVAKGWRQKDWDENLCVIERMHKTFGEYARELKELCDGRKSKK